MTRCFYAENEKCYSEPCERLPSGISKKDCTCPCDKYKNNSLTIMKGLSKIFTPSKDEEKIVHENTDCPVCPHCGTVIYNSRYCTSYDDFNVMKCPSCDQVSIYKEHTVITYTTSKTTEEEILELENRKWDELSQLKNMLSAQKRDLNNLQQGVKETEEFVNDIEQRIEQLEKELNVKKGEEDK